MGPELIYVQLKLLTFAGKKITEVVKAEHIVLRTIQR